MEPAIRYTRSPDGMNIAFWEMGEGRPLVVMPSVPFSHLSLEWRMAECRAWYEGLMAAGHRVVRYDARGTGLSDRDTEDFSIGAYTGDLEAVLTAAGVEQCAVFATGDMGMAAVAWAAEHPERATALLLWCAWARRADVSGSPQTKALRALLDQDWTIYTETAARVLVGWSNEEEARRFAAFYRHCTTPEVLRRSVPAVYEWDVSGLLERVTCPTLVMQRRNTPAMAPEAARRLAAGIPNARLVLVDGASPLPFREDTGRLLHEIAVFLGDEAGEPPAPREAPAQPPQPASDAPVVILFTDMTGSTALTQRLGDAAAQEVVREHNRIVREALAGHGGKEVKHTGDGLMVSFTSATRALECGIAIQRAVARRLEADPECGLLVRVGINAGEPLAEGGDYFGTAVQLAARICDLAQPGQVLVSGVVRDLVAGKRFLFADCGEAVPRGFEDSVRLFEAKL